LQHQRDHSIAQQAFDRPFGACVDDPIDPVHAPVRLDFQTRSGGTIAIVTAEGRITAANAAALRESLDQALATMPRAVIVDMAALDAVCARGLKILITAQRRANVLGVPIILARAGQRIRQILTIARCDTLFVLTGTVAQAHREIDTWYSDRP